MTMTVPLSALATSLNDIDADLTMKYMSPKDAVRLYRHAEYLWGLEIHTLYPTHECSIVKLRKSMERCIGTSWTLAPTEKTLAAMVSFQHRNGIGPVSERKSVFTEFAAAEHEYIFVPLRTDIDFFALEPGRAPQRFSAPYTDFPRVTSSVNPFFVTLYSRRKIKRSNTACSKKWHDLFTGLHFPLIASVFPHEFLSSCYPPTLVTVTDHGSEPDLHHGDPESNSGSDATVVTLEDECPSCVPGKDEYIWKSTSSPAVAMLTEVRPLLLQVSRSHGDPVNLFSCGGPGQVTNSQLFPFVAADLTVPYALTPSNAKGVCLINNNGRLRNVACDTTKPSATQGRVFFSLFTIVA
ncbi:hypothetical protein C8R47DRAFT_1298996 [Mycena vitilis]|nr:hypothetical protein C8R47DRAFT_1298996 [Mycena vitilis]